MGEEGRGDGRGREQRREGGREGKYYSSFTRTRQAHNAAGSNAVGRSKVRKFRGQVAVKTWQSKKTGRKL